MTTIYDPLLREKLSHLNLHPNLLPHIGKNFEQANTRVLIVAESHFLPKEHNNLINFNDWYECSEDIYKRIGKSQGWFKTRDVVSTYFRDKAKSKVKNGLKLFQSLESAYKEIYKDKSLLEEVVFINYFQRPAEREGQSIKIHPIDSKVALENIKVLIDVLKLNKIIFVSSKAYNDFMAKTTEKERESMPFIGFVPHPSASSWWNRSSTKYGTKEIKTATGREKFIRLLQPKTV